MSLATLVGLAVVGEIGVRLCVPESTFCFLANVYRADADADIGYTLRPDYDGTAYNVPLRCNRWGFRGPDWPEAKPADTLRIALIGDSHAFGFGVAFEDTLGERLARRLNARGGRRCEVLNFGVSGYNSKQELAVLQRCALRFSPDLVLVVPCNNDADAPMWVDADGWMRFEARTGDPGIGGQDWRERAFERFRKGALAHSRLLLWLRVLWYRASLSRAGGSEPNRVGHDPRLAGAWLGPLPDAPPPSELMAPVYVPLAQMIDLCRARGIAIVIAPFAAVPDWRVLFAALAREKNVPLIELLALLPDASSYDDLVRRWSLGWDPHMNADAQACWANGLAELFAREHLLGQ